MHKHYKAKHHARVSHPDAVSQWPPLLSMLHLPPNTPFITQQMRGRFTRALTRKDNEANKHAWTRRVSTACAEWQSENTEAIAMPNRWLDRPVALLVYFKAMQTKTMNVLVLHIAFGCYQKVTPAFNDISIAAKGWDGPERREDDNMTCYGTEGVDSRPNTSPYWCTKCCDTRHQQDGLSLSPSPRHPNSISVPRAGHIRCPEPSGSGYRAHTSKLTKFLVSLPEV